MVVAVAGEDDVETTQRRNDVRRDSPDDEVVAFGRRIHYRLEEGAVPRGAVGKLHGAGRALREPVLQRDELAHGPHLEEELVAIPADGHVGRRDPRP